MSEAISDLRRRLESASDTATREWWERYLRGTARFLGVPMPTVRKIAQQWWEDHEFASLARAGRVALACDLIELEHTEEKLAGILILENLLIQDLRDADLRRFEALFRSGAIADWNVCDGFCVKVLGKWVRLRGEPLARRIAAWKGAEPMWQRRAAAVAFVNLVKDGSFGELLLDVAASNVQSSERFLQTSVGWTLRELSHSDPESVRRFVEEHRDQMSREALKSATAKLPPVSAPSSRRERSGRR